jgi:ribosomal protein S18 acetylase RimI-like enzyme
MNVWNFYATYFGASMDLRLYDLREDDFDGIIKLGNVAHGTNYTTHAALENIYRLSCSNGVCCSKVIYDKPRGKGKLVGFRLTYAPGNWEPDRWCSPEEWEVDPTKVCYFKSNTIDADYRGLGIGPHLLDVSIQVAQKQGAVAGVSHVWLKSPGSNPFHYFTKKGGKLIAVWTDRWEEDLEKFEYACKVCCVGGSIHPCICPAAEMILYFGEQK